MSSVYHVFGRKRGRYAVGSAAGAMRFRATAKSSERSNAAGAVELECAEQGLLLGYRGVFALSDGYVPGAVATGADLTVPWASINQTSLEGDELFLEVDVSITPLNRLCLTGFSAGEDPLPPDTRIALRILRGGTTAFEGSTTLAQMRRTPEELVQFLYRETSFPQGCVLLTGTGVVPPDEFTLREGDAIAITVDPIGTLENVVR